MKHFKIVLTLILLLTTVSTKSIEVPKEEIPILMNELVVVAHPILEQDELIDRIMNIETSECGKDFIKSHEGYRDRAYTINDGMITIGYGHAERIGRSRYRLGQKISIETAERLFNVDVWEAEQGVKKILIENICFNDSEIYITQSMFDALVSMAYNMGVNGLATTTFIERLVESENPIETAELIKTTRIRGWSGLKKRREGEYKLFISSSINQIS